MQSVQRFATIFIMVAFCSAPYVSKSVFICEDLSEDGLWSMVYGLCNFTLDFMAD